MAERFVGQVDKHEIARFCRRADLPLDQVLVIADHRFRPHRDMAVCQRLGGSPVGVVPFDDMHVWPGDLTDDVDFDASLT